jgi:hypothetical protein
MSSSDKICLLESGIQSSSNEIPFPKGRKRLNTASSSISSHSSTSVIHQMASIFHFYSEFFNLSNKSSLFSRIIKYLLLEQCFLMTNLYLFCYCGFLCVIYFSDPVSYERLLAIDMTTFLTLTFLLKFLSAMYSYHLMHIFRKFQYQNHIYSLFSIELLDSFPLMIESKEFFLYIMCCYFNLLWDIYSLVLLINPAETATDSASTHTQAIHQHRLPVQFVAYLSLLIIHLFLIILFPIFYEGGLRAHRVCQYTLVRFQQR